MHTSGPRSAFRTFQKGVTLLETVVFIVVVSIALGALLTTFNESVSKSTDPVIRLKALEKAQALMDEILVRKFDENTPTGGVPACDSSEGTLCAGITPDADFDDVGDYHGFLDGSDPSYPVSVTVVNAGAEIGIANTQARRITITASSPNSNDVVLSAYKVNF